jgi:hypothetical protein
MNKFDKYIKELEEYGFSIKNNIAKNINSKEEKNIDENDSDDEITDEECNEKDGKNNDIEDNKFDISKFKIFVKSKKTIDDTFIEDFINIYNINDTSCSYDIETIRKWTEKKKR